MMNPSRITPVDGKENRNDGLRRSFGGDGGRCREEDVYGEV